MNPPQDPLFETKDGAYVLQPKTGLAYVHGKKWKPMRVIGCVDPKMKLSFREQPDAFVLENLARGAPAILMTNIAMGYTGGFRHEFVPGYVSFGIGCEASDIEAVGNGEVILEESFREQVLGQGKDIWVEIGSPIIRVHRQLTEAERGYRVL